MKKLYFLKRENSKQCPCEQKKITSNKANCPCDDNGSCGCGKQSNCGCY